MELTIKDKIEALYHILGKSAADRELQWAGALGFKYYKEYLEYRVNTLFNHYSYLEYLKKKEEFLVSYSFTMINFGNKTKENWKW